MALKTLKLPLPEAEASLTPPFLQVLFYNYNI